jgi:hypothetical protein
LEVVILHYGEPHTDLDLASDETFSLPRLRSFIHDSPYHEYELGLFNQLSLPSTCQVRLAVKAADPGCFYLPTDVWTPTLPTIRDPSYLSDTRRIRIGFHASSSGGRTRLRLELVRPSNAITAFDRRLHPPLGPSDYSPDGFLAFLKKIETSSVETMCFYRFPRPYKSTTFHTARNHISQELQKLHNFKTLIISECDLALFLLPCERWCPTIDTLVVYSNWMSNRYTTHEDYIIDQAQEIARLRSEAGSRLKTLILVFQDTTARSRELERLREHQAELEQLRNYVGWLEVVAGKEALSWNINKYFLGDPASFLSKSNV